MRIANAQFNEELAPDSVLQGSFIGSLLFLVLINELPGELRLFCSMFADGHKKGSKITNDQILKSDLMKMTE